MQATLTPTIPPPRTSLLGTPAGELVLQICGGEHDGRLLRLNAAKCLIGSAEGCTLRLRARGIRPVHALILRGPAGCVVRCWSPDAQLNDRGFEESVLRIGDKLQIGPITLAVVELAQSTPSPESAFCLPARSVGAESISGRPRPNSRNRRRQLFEQLRRERDEQTSLQVTVATQQAELSALELQLQQVQAQAAAASAQSPQQLPQTDDLLNQQLMKTIQQLQQELETAAKRRTVEQQSAARQRTTWDEQSDQRLQAKLTDARRQLQAEHEQQLAAATAELTAKHERQLTFLQQQQATFRREVESLQTALDVKTKNEELTRCSLATQIEQLNQAFALVRRERDELFEQLHAEQETLDRQSSHSQAQIDDIRRSAQTQINEAQATAQKQLFQLREEFAVRERQWDEELIARTKAEAERRAAEAERMTKLTAEYESLRTEATAAAAGNRLQQEGFTQARKRLEAEIASLNGRLQQSERILHEARENSGQVQAAVLADAEQARAQRDAVREQMLRQQQDWTEFRSRLEIASTAERDLAQARYSALEADLFARNEVTAQLQTECASLEQQLEKRQIELEQSQEALFAAESGANQRLQQMTVSMEQLQLDRGGSNANREREQAEWDREREALAQCVADLQHEVSQLTANLQILELQSQQATLAAAARVETTQQQLQLAQEQLTHWQIAAAQAKQQSAELLQAAARFQEQEQAWQREREQLDQLQQVATNRLQHLESSITELKHQLDEAQQAVAVPAPQPPPSAPSPSVFENVSSTININNQDLAALHEQMNEPPPSLLAPREVTDPGQLAAFQAREATLQAQADELAAQQAQLEEEQAIVARQRIELEQFQASLVDLERSLTEQAEALLQHSAPTAEPHVEPAHDLYGESYYGEAERESNPLSESEAFAAMADQVANLYRTPAEPSDDVPSDVVHVQAAAEELNYASSSDLSPSAEVCSPLVDEVVEQASEDSLVIPTPATPAFENDVFENVVSGPIFCEPVTNELDSPANPTAPPAIIEPAIVEPAVANPAIIEPTVIAPENDEDFDRQLDARIARVMRRENTPWQDAATNEAGNGQFVTAAPESAPEIAAPSQSQAVNSVLDRLREAGLWKGEGTAKADQLPSSNHPIDEGGTGLCRLSQVGPVGHEEVAEEPAESIPFDTDEQQDAEGEQPQPGDLSLLAKSRSAPSSLLNPPASEQSEADDSIESYMSRLMARLKTTDVEEPRQTNSRAEARNLRATPPPTPPPPPKATDSKPLTCLTELAPRSQAPELSSNLAAMRELANSAARGAIESHQQRSGKQRVGMRTINTLMALLVCSGLLFYWSRTGSWIALGGVGLSLLWAIGSSLVAALQSMKLRKAGKTTEESPRVE